MLQQFKVRSTPKEPTGVKYPPRLPRKSKLLFRTKPAFSDLATLCQRHTRKPIRICPVGSVELRRAADHNRSCMLSKGRTVADSIAERLTRPTAYKFKTDCSIIPVGPSTVLEETSLSRAGKPVKKVLLMNLSDQSEHRIALGSLTQSHDSIKLSLASVGVRLGDAAIFNGFDLGRIHCHEKVPIDYGAPRVTGCGHQYQHRFGRSPRVSRVGGWTPSSPQERLQENLELLTTKLLSAPVSETRTEAISGCLEGTYPHLTLVSLVSPSSSPPHTLCDMVQQCPSHLDYTVAFVVS
ncbi:hypothetical protein Tco_0703274 [Tanacetum coccineum]|uniref:Uncharacterized protein n=1 Tax=Tanacetum coccineum TaxID=301880 RepID=A0ABQ4XZX6_9ASTR